MLIFLRCCYQYKTFKFDYAPNNLEYVAFKVWNSGKALNLVFTYNPPYNIISTMNFINFFTPVARLKNVLFMGDLNSQNPV